jgi:predicted nucleotidyltransferase
MGPSKKDIKTTSIGDALFTKTQQRVLGLLYGNPGKSFYTNEIVRFANMGRGTVKRELERLVSAGLLVLSREGNQLHYKANPDNPIYNELLALVENIRGDSTQNAEGVKRGARQNLSSTSRTKSNGNMDTDNQLIIGETVSVSRKALAKLAQRYHIRRLVLFGSAARGKLKPDSDIDLLVEFTEGEAPSLGGMVRLQNDFVVLFGGRKVDVATPAILNNPYRKRAIEKDMEVLYAA